MHNKRPRQLADQGWAWVVMTAVFFNMMFCYGYVRSFGILFFEFQEKYQTSSSVTALVMGIQGAVFSISGFLAQNLLSACISVRVTAILGGVLSSSGVILSLFANNIPLLITTQSLLMGCGNALIVSSGIVLLGKYFNKHRSLAIAVANTGGNIGAITVPSLIRFLIDEYGLSGVYLIYGGLCLHTIVCGALHRPLEDAMTESGQQRTPSDDSKEEEGNDTQYTSNTDLTIVSISTPSTSYSIDSNVCELNPGCGARFRNLTDFSLFRKSRFYFLLAIAMLGVMAGVLMGVYLPALGTDKGVSRKESAMLLSANGAMGVFSQIAVGVFADRGIMKRNHILALSMFIAGFTAVLAPLYHGFASLLAYSLINGFFSSLYFSLIPVIIVDFLGLEKLAKAFGFIHLTQGASLAAAHPIAGFLRDRFGDFEVSFQFFGASSILCACLLLLGTFKMSAACDRNPNIKNCRSPQEN